MGAIPSKQYGDIWSSCGMSSAMWSASAVMHSCFAISLELQCATEHVPCVTRRINYAYILNTNLPAWRAVHLLSLAVYEKTNCTLRLPATLRVHFTWHYSLHLNSKYFLSAY